MKGTTSKKGKWTMLNCDEFYSATHDCKGRFFMFVTDDDDKLEYFECENPYNIEEIAYDLVLTGEMSSLNSLFGQNNPRSLRI